MQVDCINLELFIALSTVFFLCHLSLSLLMEDVTSYPVQENIASSISSVLGRQTGTSEGEKKFLEKPLTKKIVVKIQEKLSVIEISSIWNALQPQL